MNLEAFSARGETFEECPRCKAVVLESELMNSDPRVPGACAECCEYVREGLQ